MSIIQGSIEISVPITRLYVQLIHFEDYPRFLDGVEKVHKTDLRHLHWTVRKEGRLEEWDAELTEQEENHHIVWHNANDRNDRGRIELDELGPNLSKVIVTLDTNPGRFPGITGGETEEEISQRLNQDLKNLKELLEERGPQFNAQHLSQNAGDASELDAQDQADIMNEARQPSMRRTAASMSGSPTEVLEDEPNEAGVDALVKRNAAADIPPSGGGLEGPAK